MNNAEEDARLLRGVGGSHKRKDQECDRPKAIPNEISIDLHIEKIPSGYDAPEIHHSVRKVGGVYGVHRCIAGTTLLGFPMPLFERLHAMTLFPSTKNPILCSGGAKTRGKSPILTQKWRFCARNARKHGFRRAKAHKNPDFVLEKTGIGIEKSTCGLPANHRARFQNANTS